MAIFHRTHALPSTKEVVLFLMFFRDSWRFTRFGGPGDVSCSLMFILPLAATFGAVYFVGVKTPGS